MSQADRRDVRLFRRLNHPFRARDQVGATGIHFNGHPHGAGKGFEGGFDDVVGLEFACKSFQLLDLSNAGGCLDLDQWIAFMKISKHMASIRRPIIKFFHFVDVNQRRSIDMHDLDSALMYLALPPLRTEDRERLSKLCNADDELEFEVRRTCIRIVSITGLEYVTHSCIFNLQVFTRFVKGQRQAGLNTEGFIAISDSGGGS